MNSKGSLTKPIVKESLDRKAATQLRDAVLSGELAPGQRLTEQQIASQLGLSRGTVRTALHRLASEGLIVQNMYSSWEVMRLTSEDAHELYTLRASLEGLAGRLAVRIMSPEKCRMLSESFQNLLDASTSGSSKQLADADLDLHRTIVALSENKRLIHHYQQVEMQLRMYIASINAELTNPETVAAVHKPMVDALLSENAEAAERLLVEHCQVYGDRLVRVLGEQEHKGS